MKRYIFSIAVVAFAISAQAQDMFDVMRYSGNDIIGTARYMSMAGAFGALGGDASAITDNPAGLGIYRTSEITVTADFLTTEAKSQWGMPRTESDFNFAMNNAALVWSFIDKQKEKGWVANNISFSYNRVKNFNRTMSAANGFAGNSLTDFMAGFTDGFEESALQFTDDYNPYNNINVPYLSVLGYQGYLINPDTINVGKWYSLLNEGETAQANYKIVENGYIDEYSLAYGANVANIFYWGASFNLQSLEYSAQSIYHEAFEQGGEFALHNTFRTSGVGFNFKFGVIARPVSFLRLGFSVHTPTYYEMTDKHYGSIDYNITKKGSTETPLATSYYEFQSPLRLQASAAFILGKKAIVSFDYQYTDYKNTKLYANNVELNIKDAYADVMEDVKTNAHDGHLFKLGAEFRVTNTLALRGGVAYRMPNINEDATKLVAMNTTRTDMEYFKDNGMCYGSLGFGYRGKTGFGIDATYAYRQQRDIFTPYPDSGTQAQIRSHAHNAVVTLSYKF